MPNAMNAVKSALVQKWPSRKPYVDFLPKNFARPSFFIERVRVGSVPHTRNTVEITEFLSVTCLEPIENYNQQTQSALLETQMEVLRMFDTGIVKDGTRALKVTASLGGSDIGEAYVDLTVTYVDDKNETKPICGNMQDIKIKYGGDL